MSIPLPPDRLKEARQKIEAGESVDWNRLGQLQTLDVAIFSHDCAVEFLKRQELANDDLERLFSSD